jgi:transcriptional regulator with XRE-family HTH domain
MHLGKKIRKARINKDITQEELASKINKTRALVSHIEQTVKVNHYTLIAIAKALSITVEDIELIDEKQITTTKKQKSDFDLINKEVEHLKNENALLKEIISHQKKLIATLESGKKK